MSTSPLSHPERNDSPSEGKNKRNVEKSGDAPCPHKIPRRQLAAGISDGIRRRAYRKSHRQRRRKGNTEPNLKGSGAGRSRHLRRNPHAGQNQQVGRGGVRHEGAPERDVPADENANVPLQAIHVGLVKNPRGREGNCGEKRPHSCGTPCHQSVSQSPTVSKSTMSTDPRSRARGTGDSQKRNRAPPEPLGSARSLSPSTEHADIRRLHPSLPVFLSAP